VAGIPSTTQETTVVQTTTVTKVKADGVLVHTDIPSDLSIEGMFKAADPIVKIVMGLLAGASIATWSIFFFKLVELTIARSRAGTDLRKIAAASSLRLAAASLRKGPVAMLSRAAEQEIAASDTLPAEGIKERVAIALQRIESNASRRIGAGTGVLASVGSTGPFIGLFGTVWGIMNSFIHISNAHTTNLSVVAPGIAEALLATAMGLVAAIPAVVIYNMFSRWIAAYRLLLGDGSAVIMRHVSRDLDRIASTHSRVAAE
jgi:biopolymer transport protein ExbB